MDKDKLYKSNLASTGSANKKQYYLYGANEDCILTLWNVRDCLEKWSNYCNMQIRSAVTLLFCSCWHAKGPWKDAIKAQILLRRSLFSIQTKLFGPVFDRYESKKFPDPQNPDRVCFHIIFFLFFSHVSCPCQSLLSNRKEICFTISYFRKIQFKIIMGKHWPNTPTVREMFLRIAFIYFLPISFTYNY